MTEQVWLTGTQPGPMLEFLKGRATDRKLRLLAVACCRAVWDSLTHERSKQAVESAEQFADGLIDDLALTRSHSMAFDALARYQEVLFRGRRRLMNRDGETLIEHRLRFAAQSAHVNRPFLIGRLRWVEHDPELSSLAPLSLRDIFGNPFRPVAFDPAWRSEAAVGIARGIYEERAFERMPILADALQEAGCEHPDILAHCREPGTHVRGCWVVDLVLGKE